MQIAEAFVEVRPDTSRFGLELEKNLAGPVKKSASSLASTMAGVFAGGVFLKGMKDSTDAASNLNEQVNRTTLIFPGASATIDKYASNAAEKFGMSERAFRDATSGLGGLLQNLGFTEQAAVDSSIKLTQLGADMGSAFNKEPAEAIAAIGSALRGESEPIRAFNVILDEARIKAKALEMGLYSGKGAIDDNAKATATLALITEQTSKVQGDFANTIDGAANAERVAAAKREDASASMGQNFLPIYEKAVKVVGQLADVFGELPGPMQTGVVALAGVIALSGPLKRFVGLIKDISDGFKKMGTSGRALTALSPIIGTALLIYSSYAAEKDKARQVTEEFTTALQAEADGQQGAIDALVARKLAESGVLDIAKKAGLSATDLARVIRGEQVPAWNAYNDAIADGIDRGDRMIASQNNVAEAADLNAKEQLTLSATIGSLATAHTNAADAMALVKAVSSDLAAAQAGTNKVIVAGSETLVGYKGELTETGALYGTTAELAAAWAEKVGKAGGKASDSAKNLASWQEHAAEAADTLTLSEAELYDELANVASALDELIGKSLSMEQANQALYEGTEAITESFKKNGKTLDISTAAGRANRDVVADQVENIIAHGKALLNQGATQEEATTAIELGRQALLAQMTQLGYTTEEAQAYVDQLGLTPANIVTAVSLANTEAMKGEINDIIERLGPIDDDREAHVQALIDEGKYEEALAMLKALERDIKPRLIVRNGVTVDSGTVFVDHNARGRYYGAGANRLTTVAEPGAGPEAILPLGNPSRLDALLADPRIGGPIAAAMGGDGADVMSSGGASVMPTASGGVQINITLADVGTIRAVVVEEDRAKALQFSAGRRASG